MSPLALPFGQTPAGQSVTVFVCTNARGLVLKIMDFGASIVALEAPDRAGELADIQLGFPTLEGYLSRHPYFGSTIGRYGNRIAQGRFSIGERSYKLATNDGSHHLHGGVRGFDAVLWQAEPFDAGNARGVRFSYLSPDGEEGYPGNLSVQVTYSLTDADELRIDYEAHTDQPTHVNLSNHTYWNLGGGEKRSILDHELQLAADAYLPVDAGAIPTGELAPVKGTSMDFTTPHVIGERIEKLKTPGQSVFGYDHCYVLRSSDGRLGFAARAKCSRTGRVMEVFTTEPGIQLYTGNFLNGNAACGGYPQHSAFCLETQHFPDSPNRPEFPSTLLSPGQVLQSTTLYRFSAEA